MHGQKNIEYFKKFLKICFSFKEGNMIVIIAEEWPFRRVTNTVCAKMNGVKIAGLTGYDAV